MDPHQVLRIEHDEIPIFEWLAIIPLHIILHTKPSTSESLDELHGFRSTYFAHHIICRVEFMPYSVTFSPLGDASPSFAVPSFIRRTKLGPP